MSASTALSQPSSATELWKSRVPRRRHRRRPYTGADAGLIARAVVGTDGSGGRLAGFDPLDLTDPLIVADIDGDGALTGEDATLVAQRCNSPAGTPTIPAIPPSFNPPSQPGSDPTFSIDANLRGTGY